MKTRSHVFFLCLTAVAISSCSGRSGVQTQTSISKTETILEFEWDRQTPTQTVAPQSTRTPSITSTITSTPTDTPSGPLPRYEVPSPDGVLVARYFDEWATQDQTQRIVIDDSDGASLHVVEYFIENPMSSPRPNLAIFEWSPDSSRLYFYKSFGFDGGGQIPLWEGLELSAITIETGEIQPIITREGLSSFSFSPDQSKLIYAVESDLPRHIRVLNRETSKERAALVPIPSPGYTQVGRFEWAPIENIVIFQATSDIEMYLYSMNIDTLEVKLLLRFWGNDFGPWTEDRKLQYTQPGSRAVFELDVLQGVSLPIGTATPQP